MARVPTAAALRRAKGRRSGVTQAPRRPELRSGRAGNDVSGLEHRRDSSFSAELQFLAGLRRQRQVERLHALGARVIFELIEQLDRDHGLGRHLDRQLERFGNLDPALVRWAGGDRFATSPIRIVGDRP